MPQERSMFAPVSSSPLLERAGAGPEPAKVYVRDMGAGVGSARRSFYVREHQQQRALAGCLSGATDRRPVA